MMMILTETEKRKNNMIMMIEKLMMKKKMKNINMEWAYVIATLGRGLIEALVIIL